MKHKLTKADILSLENYERIRDTRRREIIDMKKNRRVAVGPYATFYFENYDTMWLQVQEMLRVEKGGEMELRIGAETIRGQAEEDLDYTSEEGKASSVQFVHFSFTPAQVKAFRAGGDVTVAITHPAYGHMAIMPQPVKDALMSDFN
jgi:hypothetical protein